MPKLLSDTYVIVVDIGATWIKIGDLEVPEPSTLRTPPNVNDALDAVATAISTHPLGSHPDALVVLGVPGIITNDGYVRAAIHSPIVGVSVFNELRKRLPATRNITISNDADVQARGVPRDLIGSQLHLHVALGTGVGGCIISNGKVLHNGQESAGEIGHIPSGLSFSECPCGRIGCVDRLSSGASLERDLGPQWWQRTDDPDVWDRIDRAAVSLVEGVVTVRSLTGLESCSIAGHLAALPRFTELVDSRLDTMSISPTWYPNSWPLIQAGAAHMTRHLRK